MANMNFVINIRDFEKTCGGTTAMHKLCHDINSLGNNSYLTCDKTYSTLNCKFLRDSTGLTINNSAIIYPEVTCGNPYNLPHVVRWILNTPGRCGSADGFYSNLKDTDLFFKYSNYFSINDESRSLGLLTTFFIDYDIYKNRKENRSGSCFFVKKGGMKQKVHPDDSIILDDSDWQKCADIFNKTEYFYCYDNACFWVVLAALCGCVPIVIPDSNMVADEWYSKFPHKKTGVAYGFDKMDHAKSTLNDVKDSLLEFEKKNLATVQNMINICEERFC